MPDKTLDQKIEDALIAMTNTTGVINQGDIDGVVANVTAQHNMEKASERGDHAGSDSAEPTYVVRKDDTLTAIARLYSTTPEKIAAANKIKNINEIKEGQVLDMSFAIAL